jgi:hypothetical protein
MYSFLNDGEKYSNKSDDWQLLPEVKELWDVMEKINAKSEGITIRDI